MSASEDSNRLPRRTTLKWFAAAASSLYVSGPNAFTADAAAEEAAIGSTPNTPGYGTDPKVAGIYKPGDFWPLTLTEKQRQTSIALADVILPADDLGPAASTLNVTDYIDEWISAPYPAQRADAEIIVPGLDWLEEESQKRFSKDFPALTITEQQAICDDICWAKEAKPEFKTAARFFEEFRALASGAYYSTPAGWKAIGYVGNVPMVTFDGPPQEVLDQLGVTQTVE